MAHRDNETKRLGKTLIQVIFWLCLGGTLAYANANWHKQSPIPGPGNQVVATAVTPNGTHAATVTADGHISLWDLDTRKLIRSKHLPQGTPHHLAIRNQADAIAVAYEDANAVIWWCDGSDRLVLPDVDARLVRFAHQAQSLVSVNYQGGMDSWDINTGNHLSGSHQRIVKIALPALNILPSDRAAIVHQANDYFFNNMGFVLKDGGRLTIEGSYQSQVDYDNPLKTTDGEIVVDDFNTAQVTFRSFDHQSSSAFSEQGKTGMFPPVCLIKEPPSIQTGGWHQVNQRVVSPLYIPVSVNNTVLGIASGNTSGDLILYRRAQPNDWIYHPAAWLLVIFGLAFMAQIVNAIIRISRNKKRHPNPADVSLPLPTSTRLAAYVIAVVGGLMIVEMVAGLFFGSFNLNLMVLLLPAGIIVMRRKSNGWRKCGVFFIWPVLVVGGSTLGTSLLAGQPLEVELGGTEHFAPAWVGIVLGTIVTLIGAFGWHAFTDPRAKHICAAASYVSQYNDLEMRRNALLACPECGYDTRQTVSDGLAQCPECGRAIAYADEDRAWINRRVDDWRQPLED